MDPESLATLISSKLTLRPSLHPTTLTAVIKDDNGYPYLGVQLRTNSGRNGDGLQEDWQIRFDPKDGKCKGRREYSNTHDYSTRRLTDNDVNESAEFLDWQAHCAQKPEFEIEINELPFKVVDEETKQSADSVGAVMGNNFCKRYGASEEDQLEESLKLLTMGGESQD